MPLMSTRSEILAGLDAELKASAESFRFVVKRTWMQGDAWTVQVDLSQSNSGLDESMEGAVAWWPGEPPGAADVLSVIPEYEQLNIRYATKRPPGTGEVILVFPPQYLKALIEIWQSPEFCGRLLEWLGQTAEGDSIRVQGVESNDCRFYPWLRKNQAEATRLTGFSLSYLWGPPGTGKTTLIGVLVALFVRRFPTAKVLLLSSTNSATDLALLAVDRALEELGKFDPACRETRKRCYRIGTHFVARNYQGRGHLIPAVDDALVRSLISEESKRPDKTKVAEYHEWQKRVDAIRSKIRAQSADVVATASVSAMTTTRATTTFSQLSELPPFDLVVFDEASQVGKTHAAPLATLGHRVLFGGDPKQLAPIVRSDHAHAQSWLGKSMFDYMDEERDNTCMLKEQSRMEESICTLVSKMFYRNELRVAGDVINDPEWRKHRELQTISLISNRHVHVELIEAASTWSQRYRGPIRYESARWVSTVITELAQLQNPDEIAVLTPFRAQRTLIRTFIENSGIKRVLVSTVHRVQGDERHTIIFDPVNGSCDFMRGPDAQRLINVAFSRAQARLIVVLNESDKQNPNLGWLYDLCRRH